MPVSGKAEDALKTISEVSDALGIPQHILRYWETRFPALRPLTRAGKRRYYRPADVALVQRIDQLLNREGYTVRGVQKLLAARGGDAPPSAPSPAPEPVLNVATAASGIPVARLREIRDRLSAALRADRT